MKEKNKKAASLRDIVSELLHWSTHSTAHTFE